MVIQRGPAAERQHDHVGTSHDSVDPDADLTVHRLSSQGPLDEMPPDQAQASAPRLPDRTADLVRLAGYDTDDPLVLGVRQGSAATAFLTSGRTAAGEPLSAGTVVYTASLSKQITAACAALLVRQGRLHTESTLAQWMPELPAWAGSVRVHHLIHHTSGLPDVPDFYELHRAGLDRTTPEVIRALVGVHDLVSKPGTEFRYCNAGYVCLAAIVERAAGRPLPDFAREHVFEPLGMVDSRYWSGPAPHPPGAVPVDGEYPAPLSLGDGGVWSTAQDLMRWNEALERDELGVSALVHTPGHLDDGTQLEYGWGVDVLTTHADRRIHRHGGLWAGLSAQLIRVADQRRSSLVIIALDTDEHRTVGLADVMIEELTA